MNLIVCVCEGAAERAILDILLDAGKLRFSREDLLGNKVLDGYYRKPAHLERDYLNKHFAERITLYLVIDSKKAAKNGYKCSKPYRDKIELISAVTHPEIEILYIYSRGKYGEYSRKYKSTRKPSQYVKEILRISNVKDYETAKKEFAKCDHLLACMKKYKQSHKNEPNTLFDLILPE